ncbi:MAG: hypothetical protein RMJ54_18590, partial [Roseiflexaceae bacterium]|nr:hypothetical protein [Roseiflexaceae bacterium]
HQIGVICVASRNYLVIGGGFDRLSQHQIGVICVASRNYLVIGGGFDRLSQRRLSLSKPTPTAPPVQA